MKTYQPISCNYYDYLLELATFKKLVSIVYIEHKVNLEINSIIVDVYTKKGIEFLKTKHDIIIRLDQIVSVDNKLNTNESCSIK